MGRKILLVLVLLCLGIAPAKLVMNSSSTGLNLCLSVFICGFTILRFQLPEEIEHHEDAEDKHEEKHQGAAGRGRRGGQAHIGDQVGLEARLDRKSVV